MKFVLLLGEVSREICEDFLRTAATKMRDQQEDPRAMCHRLVRED